MKPGDFVAFAQVLGGVPLRPDSPTGFLRCVELRGLALFIRRCGSQTEGRSTCVIMFDNRTWYVWEGWLREAP